jgi:hypothetical protein
MDRRLKLAFGMVAGAAVTQIILAVGLVAGWWH